MIYLYRKTAQIVIVLRRSKADSATTTGNKGVLSIGCQAICAQGVQFKVFFPSEVANSIRNGPNKVVAVNFESCFPGIEGEFAAARQR